LSDAEGAITPQVRVGFVGLGDQGTPMALRIIDAGFPTTVYARRESVLEPFRASGASLATSLLELGERSDLLGICVSDDDAVREVVDGALPAMTAGSVIAVHSTVHPNTCREIAERAATRSVRVVDAPVSGMAEAAAAGRLVVMVGGTANDFRFTRPVFETFGHPFHLGPLGAGQTTKVINNLIAGAQLFLAHEAFDVAGALGLAIDQVAEVLLAGSAASWSLDLYARTGFSLEVGRKNGLAGIERTARKDFLIATELADDHGAEPAALRFVTDLYLDAIVALLSEANLEDEV
jgi:3-hydroxyisobutyrate dehydrogenase-like beta-hydroxyacid dehydrogenase